MWLNVSERLLLQDLLEHLMEMHFALEASFVHRQLTSLILTIFHMPDNPLHASFPLFFLKTVHCQNLQTLFLLFCQMHFHGWKLTMSWVFKRKLHFPTDCPQVVSFCIFQQISYISWHFSCVYVFFIFHKTFTSTDACWLVICIACGLILIYSYNHILIYSYTYSLY